MLPDGFEAILYQGSGFLDEDTNSCVFVAPLIGNILNVP